MKPTKIQAALAKRNRLESEIPKLQSLTDTATTRLNDLVATRDISDERVLTEAGQLLTQTALGPLKMVALETALNQADLELRGEADKFIVETHGPRSRDLMARAQTKATEALKGHFTREEHLTEAIQNSAFVIEADGLAIALGGFGKSSVDFAQKVLDLSSQADAFEKKLS